MNILLHAMALVALASLDISQSLSASFRQENSIKVGQSLLKPCTKIQQFMTF
jgi:hypothetical protein